MQIPFLNTLFLSHIVLASSPLTETAERIRQGELHGAGGAILKSCCSYTRKKDFSSRKVMFSPDGSHYYAASSFDREILTAEEGLTLYQEASRICSIPIIPSITALTLNPQDWLPLCLAFQKAGAFILQLDFFYLGTYLEQPDFAQRIFQLLDVLMHSLSCQIMPKVNIDLPADFIFRLMKKAGVRGVSLLDSVRVPATNITDSSTPSDLSTSYFGTWQLPLSLHYAYLANQYGLEICGGGGISDQASIAQMLSCGATLIQVASTVLLHGYNILDELSHITKENITSAPVPAPANYQIHKDKCTRCLICTNSSVWCDALSTNPDGTPFIRKELCENCGWCAARCPAKAISPSPDSSI